MTERNENINKVCQGGNMTSQFAFTFGEDGSITPPDGVSATSDPTSKTMQISLRQNRDENSVALNLNVDQLTQLIWYLGSLRSKMVSEFEIIQQPPNTELNNLAFNPSWYTAKDPKGPNHYISFQHPSFGPIGAVLFSPMAARLVSLLSGQLEASLDSLLKSTGEE
ncbi:MAG: hypothetical protein GX413_11160 [Acetobacter sp.]|nr:hypothetical protein [Acetobacter sp.]